MRITVKVKPNSSRESIEKTDDVDFLVRVREKPSEGKANRAVIKILSEHFKLAPSGINLIKGTACRIKVFEINPRLRRHPLS